MRNLECLTEREVLDKLGQLQGDMTRREFAQQLGVHESYVSQVFSRRKYLTPRILKSLGLKREVVYVPLPRRIKKNGRA